MGVPICLQLNDFKEHDLIASLAPQASASANSATSAGGTSYPKARLPEHRSIFARVQAQVWMPLAG